MRKLTTRAQALLLIISSFWNSTISFSGVPESVNIFLHCSVHMLVVLKFVCRQLTIMCATTHDVTIPETLFFLMSNINLWNFGPFFMSEKGSLFTSLVTGWIVAVTSSSLINADTTFYTYKIEKDTDWDQFILHPTVTTTIIPPKLDPRFAASSASALEPIVRHSIIIFTYRKKISKTKRGTARQIDPHPWFLKR